MRGFFCLKLLQGKFSLPDTAATVNISTPEHQVVTGKMNFLVYGDSAAS